MKYATPWSTSESLNSSLFLSLSFANFDNLVVADQTVPQEYMPVTSNDQIVPSSYPFEQFSHSLYATSAGDTALT